MVLLRSEFMSEAVLLRSVHVPLTTYQAIFFLVFCYLNPICQKAVLKFGLACVTDEIYHFKG